MNEEAFSSVITQILPDICTHKNLVYDLAFHSPVVRAFNNRYSGRSWVQLPLGNLEIYFLSK